LASYTFRGTLYTIISHYSWRLAPHLPQEKHRIAKKDHPSRLRDLAILARDQTGNHQYIRHGRSLTCVWLFYLPRHDHRPGERGMLHSWRARGSGAHWIL